MATRTVEPDGNQDPDDIFRDIDLDDKEEVIEENNRLIKKRKGYRSNFTLSVNSINNLITASHFDNGMVNKSQANKEALLRAREKLEVRKFPENSITTPDSYNNSRKQHYKSRKLS